MAARPPSLDPPPAPIIVSHNEYIVSLAFFLLFLCTCIFPRPFTTATITITSLHFELVLELTLKLVLGKKTTQPLQITETCDKLEESSPMLRQVVLPSSHSREFLGVCMSPVACLRFLPGA